MSFYWNCFVSIKFVVTQNFSTLSHHMRKSKRKRWENVRKSLWLCLWYTIMDSIVWKFHKTTPSLICPNDSAQIKIKWKHFYLAINRSPYIMNRWNALCTVQYVLKEFYSHWSVDFAPHTITACCAQTLSY